MRRLLANIFGFLFLCVLSLALLAGVLVQTGPVKRRLVGHFLDQVRTATGHELNVRHVRIILPFQLHASDVKIHQEGDVWLEVKSMSATWQPLNLLWDSLSIRDLQLSGVTLRHLPMPTETMMPKPEISSSPKAEKPPLDFEIQALQITHCDLSALPGVKSLPLIDLRGHVTWLPSQQRVGVQLHASDSVRFSGVTRLRAEGHRESEVFVLDSHLSESAAGPLSTLLDLPGFPTADVRLRAQGRSEDWLQVLAAPSSDAEHAISGSIEFESVGLFASEPQLERYFGSELSTDATFTIFSDHSVNIDRLKGSNSKIEYIGWLRCKNGIELRELDIDARFLDLLPLEDQLDIQLAGVLDTRVRYHRMPQGQEISVQIASEHLKVEGFSITDLSGNFSSQNPFADDMEGLFLLDYHLEDIPIFLSTDIARLSGSQWLLEGLECDLGPTHLSGKLQADFAQELLVGRLHGENQDLFGWSDHAKRRLEGDINLDIILDKDDEGSQGVSIQVHGIDVATRELKAPDLRVDCKLKDVLHNPNGTLQLSSKDLKGSGWYIDSVTVDCGHDPAGLWTYELKTHGRRYEPFELKTSGDIRIIPNQLQLTFNTCEGEVYGHSFRLRDCTELTLNRMQILLTPFLMDIDDGVILASIEDAVGGIEASLNMREIPLDILNILRPTTPVSGTLTGQARLYGARDNPIGEALIQLHNFRLQEAGFKHLNPVNAQLELGLSDGRSKVQLSVTGLDRQPIDLHGDLPIGLVLDPWRIAANKGDNRIDLTVDAHGELGGFIHLFVPDSNRLSGHYDMDLHILGTLDRPNIKGSVELHDGIYHSLHAGSTFTNIRARFLGQGSRLKLDKLAAEDGNHGHLNATGSISLRRDELYAFTLSTDIHDCLLVNQHNVQAVFEGRVKLEGDTHQGLLSGKLNAQSADLSIPEDIKTSVPKVDVVYVNQPIYEPTPSILAPVADRWILGLDLNVRARGQAFVRGRGLMSEWDGEGRIRGDTADPLLYGKLTLVRGEYNFIGRIFHLTHGELTFNGHPRKNTNMNISAELALDGLTAEAHLNGPVNEPKLSLRSNPARPLREILARILFEKEVHDISPLQGLELAQALLSFTNKGKTPDLIGTLRRQVGLDRLDISHNSYDPNEVSVHAGKYIARGVFVSVNKSINSVNNEIAIEMRLSDHVKLEGQVGDEVGSKISLKWKKDY